MIRPIHPRHALLATPIAARFANPDVAIEFDVDNTRAIASRKQVFAAAAKDRLWVSSAHLPFPGLGHVHSEGKGYAWVPGEYGPIRSDRCGRLAEGNILEAISICHHSEYCMRIQYFTTNEGEG
ncbi:hypothetical protein ACFPU0_26925 [Pseudomonas sp. GCM10022186]|uniref:hypothetical protein n=1 Tax=Pseudomonas sp. GCM10022186 TaxID=3252650 RepID=UPI0036099296